MRRPMTRIGDYLRLSAERDPGRPCFVFPDGSGQTFESTNSRVNRLASALSRHDIGKGDRVAIVAIDSAAYVEVLFACMKLGIVYVPFNNRLTEPELLTLLQRARPKALFVSSRYAEVGNRLASQVKGLHLFASFDSDPAAISYDDLLLGGEDREPDVEVGDEDIVGLAFTSGTTGLPKGVLQPQRMVKSLVINMSIDYEIQPDEFRYTASPTFHIAGQAMIFMHAWRGFPTLILPQFDVAGVLSWMQRGHLTGCFLVPTMISSLLSHPGAGSSDYPELRSIIYGSAPMSPALLRRAMDVFGCKFINAFGTATEGGLQTVLTSADHRRAVADSPHLLGSIGKAAFGVDLSIVDESGRAVPRGTVGEIITRSDAVMTGYLEMPEETQRAIQDGWFWGGDLARMDEQGYIYLAGRSKDMIIRGGENIYPVEIEAVLSDHPAVAQVAVVGRPDEHWGETVVAYLTLHAGRSVGQEDLRGHCRSRLAAYKVPAQFEVLPELPLNAAGKVLKRQLRERASALTADG